MRRGFRNNGLIEILNESESESEKIVSGVIYRLPENGIKLDFISRVKRYIISIFSSFVNSHRAGQMQKRIKIRESKC